MNNEPIKIPFSFAKSYGVVVKQLSTQQATIAYQGAPPMVILHELRCYLNRPILLEKVDEALFSKLLVKQYETDSNTAMLMAEDIGGSSGLFDLISQLPKTEDLLEKQDDAPIVRLLNALLSEAIKENASDIHIETFEHQVTIRFRVDGTLREILTPQRVLAPLITSRIKVMAQLDIAEKRLPQDGRITLHVAGRGVDVRVSTLPTSHGERIVLRILDKQTALLDLSRLGMKPHTLTLIEKMIAAPHGTILVTGPTGSGKTTTLYAALSMLNTQVRNILTVEDPIEYDLAGIGQTQVNYKVNMSFARGLRAILRQDPDVVMVGEIRDVDTAKIAIQASLTGHLVLSTLHTNSAMGAITRLTDMGVEPFLLSSSLMGVLAQRLVRLLCKKCKKAQTTTPRENLLLGITVPTIIFQPVGCSDCRDTGYNGRCGTYELIEIDNKLREMIHDKQSEQEIKKYTRAFFPSIRQDGFLRVLSGDTSLAEVLRVTSEE